MPEREIYKRWEKPPVLDSDPDTTNWGVAEAGREWYLVTAGTAVKKFWNGAAIKTITAT